MAGELLRVEAPYFVAGVVIRDDHCAYAAPIMRWACGMRRDALMKELARKRFTVTTVEDHLVNASIPETTSWFKVRNGLPVTQIAFNAVALHRRQIEHNHGETLEALSEQGGLDWYELWCGFTGRPLFPTTPHKLWDCRSHVLNTVTANSFRKKDTTRA